jgi:hypothetical protein
MKRVHLKKGTDLLRTLIVIQEDASQERDRQESMARRIKRDMNEDEEEEPKEKSDQKSDKKSDDKDSDKKPEKKKEKPSKLPGAESLENFKLPPNKTPTAEEIAKMVNYIRAGVSTNDEKVKRDIATWILQMREPERLAAFTTLDALAKITLARKPVAEIPTYEDPADLEIKGGNVSGESPVEPAKKVSTPTKKKDTSSGAPIVVGEGVIKRLREIDVPVKSGRLVSFGSAAHIKELESSIEDLKRIRSYQEHGSDTRHALGVAINALKGQLRFAMKRNGGGNPRTQAVPPLVEKEK